MHFPIKRRERMEYPADFVSDRGLVDPPPQEPWDEAIDEEPPDEYNRQPEVDENDLME